MAIKYTSQAYLEAVPGFCALVAIVAFERSCRAGDASRGRWLALSAGALGAAAAGKYLYATVGLAIAPFLPWRRHSWRGIALFGLMALGTFFILDPVLWPDPAGRLARSVLSHLLYSQSPQVTRLALPWWKPLEYLSQPVPWHPGVFYVGWDGWIFVLGLVGLPFLWQRSRPYASWLMVGLAIVLLWPTKWPHYTLIVIPPLCLSAAYGLAGMAEWADQRFQISEYLQPFAVPPSAWILAGLFGVTMAALLSVQAFLYWQGNLGWMHVNSHNSGLISDFVQAVAIDTNGRLWIGTRQGLATFDGQAWTYHTAEQGDLPSNDVRALALSADGSLWVGTDRGVSVFDGSRWRLFQAEIPGGGPVGDIHAMAIAPDGRVWIGTTHGLGLFDGYSWTAYRSSDSGLPSDLVLAVAVDHRGRVWAGTDHGAGVLDPQTETWQRYDLSTSGLQWPAVSTIAVAPDGRVWLGTLGGGVGVFDGRDWQWYTTANSGLPWNTVTALAVGPQADIWVAADLPSRAGGNVARWDGKAWTTFRPQKSGIAGGAASCFAFDSKGRVWIGMRTAGLSVYAPRPEQRR
jgi:sugar lactone lactonase YvrE